MDHSRRYALAIVAAAPLVLTGCTTSHPIPVPPIPTNVAEAFAAAERLIASMEAAVNFGEMTGWVGAETIAGARAILARARGYVTTARGEIESGGWVPLINLAWQLVSGIVLDNLMAPSAKGGAAPEPRLTLTLRKTAAAGDA